MRRWKAYFVGTIIVIALIGTIYAWNASFPDINYPDASKCTPILENVGAVHIYPDGTYAINKSVAIQFADSVIADYHALATEGEVNLQSAGSIQRFYPLYYTTGETFNVLVARDDMNKTGRIEFLFSRIGGNSPLVHVYTNQTGADLRSLYAGFGLNNYASMQYEIDCLTAGTDLRFVLNKSPVGSTNFPFIWITYLPLIQNNTLGNAEVTAQAIYNFDIWNQNVTLNPPFPHWGWFSNLFNGPYGILVDLGIIAILFTIFGVSVFDIPRLLRRRDKKEASNHGTTPAQSPAPEGRKTLSPSKARRYAKRHPESSEASSQGKAQRNESDEKGEEQHSP